MCSWNSILECTAGDYGGNVPAAIMWCVTQLFISALLLVQFRHAVDLAELCLLARRHSRKRS